MATLRRTFVRDGQLVVEEVEDFETFNGRKKHKLDNGHWVVLFQEALLKIAMDEKLTKGALRCLFYLISKTEIMNEIKLPTSVISESLGEDRSNVFRYLKELEERNILIRDRKTKLMRLNYELAYKGAFKDFKLVKYKDDPLLSKSESPQLKIKI